MVARSIDEPHFVPSAAEAKRMKRAVEQYRAARPLQSEGIYATYIAAVNWAEGKALDDMHRGVFDAEGPEAKFLGSDRILALQEAHHKTVSRIAVLNERRQVARAIGYKFHIMDLVLPEIREMVRAVAVPREGEKALLSAPQLNALRDFEPSIYSVAPLIYQAMQAMTDGDQGIAMRTLDMALFQAEVTHLQWIATREAMLHGKSYRRASTLDDILNQMARITGSRKEAGLGGEVDDRSQEVQRIDSDKASVQAVHIDEVAGHAD